MVLLYYDLLYYDLLYYDLLYYDLLYYLTIAPPTGFEPVPPP